MQHGILQPNQLQSNVLKFFGFSAKTQTLWSLFLVCIAQIFVTKITYLTASNLLQPVTEYSFFSSDLWLLLNKYVKKQTYRKEDGFTN